MLRLTLPVGVALLAACSSSSSPVALMMDASHPHVDAAHASDAGTTHRDAGKGAVDARTADARDANDASDAAEIVDAGVDRYDGPVFAFEAGITWSSLYRDYFGNPKTAACAGDGNCHGAVSQPGYMESNFLCPADAATTCFQAMTSTGGAGANLLVPDASFATDYLSMVLCQDDDNEGSMPLDCTYTFTAIDLERIGAWAQAGALDN